MTIESVRKAKEKADSFIVTFEDGTEIKVNAAQIADYGIYNEREFTQEEFAQLNEGLENSASKARALRILGSRNLSANEIEKRLIGRGESAQTARNTALWLEEMGYLNDEEYAKSIVRHYATKGYGAARIKSELFRRGIKREIWEDALQNINVEETEDAAYNYVVSRLKGSASKEDLRRVTDALCRRGYNYEEARTAVNRYKDTIGENGETGQWEEE